MTTACPPAAPDDRAGTDHVALDAMAEARPRLANWLRRHAPSSADAEDLLQDVFIELVLANRAAQHIEDAVAWLFRVARNRLVDAHRRRGAVVEARPPFDDDDASATLESRRADPAGGPEEAYGRRLLNAELAAALDALPADQREVFIAHEIDGQSLQTIATRTGAPLNTVLARKHRAVKKLRQALRSTHLDHPTD